MSETNLASDSQDYETALANLRKFNPIVSEQFWGFLGNTKNGRLVLVPSSYQIGYQSALVHSSQRPSYALNLGIIGQLSDGRWVFPPSFDTGLRDGLNDLRFALLAEGEKRLFEENKVLRSMLDEIRKKMNEDQSK